jgi:uncharacterized protein YxeA
VKKTIVIITLILITGCSAILKHTPIQRDLGSTSSYLPLSSEEEATLSYQNGVSAGLTASAHNNSQAPMACQECGE